MKFKTTDTNVQSNKEIYVKYETWWKRHNKLKIQEDQQHECYDFIQVTLVYKLIIQ